MLSATDGSDSGRRRVTRAALVVATVTVFVFLAGLLAVFTASPIAGASTRDLAVAPAVKLTVKISSPGKGAVTVKGKGVCEKQSCSYSFASGTWVTLSIKKRIDKHKKWEVGPGKVVTDPSPCQANAACKVHLYKQKEVTVTAKW